MNRVLIAVAAWLALVSAALAQSPPCYTPPGATSCRPLELYDVPQALDWNGFFTAKQDVLPLLQQYALVIGGGIGYPPGVLSSLGTATTVLHGNAAGPPSFGQVNLTTDVVGSLPGSSLAAGAAAANLGFTPLSRTNNLSDLSVTSTARANLGLSALATTTPGAGVAAALGVDVGTGGAPVINGGALGTPSSGTLTNANGLPISTGVSGLGAGVQTVLAAAVGANTGLLPVGGALMPGDCLAAGTNSVVDAGAPCYSGASTFTYNTHGALVAGVSAPGSSIFGQQQLGFYVPGDGGAATYQWSATSYCPGGTSGTPVPADSIVCILPEGQSASTAGRYILQVGDRLDVRQVGMQPSTATNLFDNSAYLPALLAAEGSPVAEVYAGIEAYFPQAIGQTTTAYYFSQALDWSRVGRITCEQTGPFQGVFLVFAPGRDGIIQDAYNMSPDGGDSSGQDVRGCRIQSQGIGIATQVFNGNNSISGVSMDTFGPPTLGAAEVIPETVWENGDGIVPIAYQWYDAPYSGNPFEVPMGTYVTNTTGGGSPTLTLSNNLAFPTTADGYSPMTRPSLGWETQIYRLPHELAYTVNIAAPVTVAATQSWTASTTNHITVASCSGVSVGPTSYVFDTSINASPQIGTVSSCNGTTLAFNANLGYPSNGSTDVLEITSSVATMTAGPQVLLTAGDQLWVPGFQFGAQVQSASVLNPNGTATATVTAPTLTIPLSTPCPTTATYPYLSVAAGPWVYVVDTTTNTALGEVASCSGSSLVIYSIPPGTTVASGDTISIPVYSTYLPLASAAGRQTINIGNRDDLAVNYFTAASGGSGLKMWLLPAGIDRRGQGQTHDAFPAGFIYGIKHSGTAGSLPPGGGNDSLDVYDTFEFNVVGMYAAGDNAGASNYSYNVFGANHYIDIIEGGTVGSNYTGDNTNSSEAGYSPGTGFAMECSSENFSVIIGSYIASGPFGSTCLDSEHDLNFPPYTSLTEGPLGIGPLQDAAIQNSPVISGQSLVGNGWSFVGSQTIHMTSGSATQAGNTIINLSPQSNWFAGIYLLDLDQQALSATVTTAGTGGGTGTCTFGVAGGTPTPLTFVYFSASTSGNTTFLSNYMPVLPVGWTFTVADSANTTYNTTYTVVSSSATVLVATPSGSPSGSGAASYITGLAPAAQFSATLSSGGLSGSVTVVNNGDYVPNYTYTIATPPNVAGNVVGTGGCASLTGAQVTVTYGSATPADDAIVSLSPTLSNYTVASALLGQGILPGDQLTMSQSSADHRYAAECAGLNGGIESTTNGLFLSSDCSSTGALVWNLQTNGIWGDWSFIGGGGGVAMGLVGTSGYMGYNGLYPTNSTVVFPDGQLIGNSSISTPGSERYLDSGAAASTSTSSLAGNLRINSTPVVGGNAFWMDSKAFGTTLSGAVTKGSTTSVAVAACPSPALPTNTRIVDTTSAPNSAYLGQLTSCTGTTLTFVAAAADNGASSDAISFLIQSPTDVIQGGLPTISSCGSGTPAVTTGSTNRAGQFTLGTGTPTACTITFAEPYPTTAFCTFSPASAGGAAISGGDYLSAMTAAGFTLTLGTGTSSLIFDYACSGN